MKSAPSPLETVRFGAFEVDLRTGELRKSGLRLKLQTQPFKLLSILLEHPGDVVSREELQRRLWEAGTVVDFDHSLGTAINKIREVLGDSADNPRFIETLSRRGYRFIAPVEPAGPLQLVAVSAPVSEKPKSRRWKIAAGLGVLAALLVLVWTSPAGAPVPRLVRTTQVTWSGHISPGDIGLESFPGLATDGGRVYFHEIRDGRIVLAESSMAGGDARMVNTPGEIAGPSLGDISPDGSQLLVRNHLAPEAEQPLWIVPTTGGAARRVLSILAHDATWMPDGQSILYAAGHDLFVTRNDGREPTKFASVPGRAFWMRWSPDGSRLRFTVLDSQTRAASLWELSATGTNLHPLLPHWNNPPAECCGNWTREGGHYVFQSTRDGISNIWALRESYAWFGGVTARPVPVTAGPLNYAAPTPARDRLFAIGTHARSELLRYDAATRHFVRYLPDLSNAGRTEFSRDGKRVAWVSTFDGSLWVASLNGSQHIQLTTPPMQVYMMRWSPDARHIAFMGKVPGHPWKIYVASSSGGDARALTTGERNQADPDWSPDGNSILFGRSPQYMAEDATSKAIHIFELRTDTISTLPGSDGLFSPRWSPDGRYIAAMTLDQRKLMLYDTASRVWTEIAARSIDNPVWASGGKYIYFHSFMEDGQPIYRLQIANRALERVAELRDVQRADASGYIFSGLSPDDSPLVSVHLWTADIYALEWNGR